MASTTSFNWETPDDTDLVKDGAAAIRTLGNSIDTSMSDLLGGTTGQVLKKNSNTDMDFVWSADSAGMTNPMTTTGDTIYSSSGSTPARLGIGTSGQVLTVSGGVPAWTTLSTAPTFVGCRVYASGSTTVNNSTDVILGFNNEDFDTNGFHDNSTNNSRITIPTGYAGKYLVTADVAWSGNSSGQRVLQIFKNGSQLLTTYSGATTGNLFGQSYVVVVNLAVGDYIQVDVNQNSGSSLTVFGSSDIGSRLTAFSATYLGA